MKQIYTTNENFLPEENIISGREVAIFHHLLKILLQCMKGFQAKGQMPVHLKNIYK